VGWWEDLLSSFAGGFSIGFLPEVLEMLTEAFEPLRKAAEHFGEVWERVTGRRIDTSLIGFLRGLGNAIMWVVGLVAGILGTVLIAIATLIVDGITLFIDGASVIVEWVANLPQTWQEFVTTLEGINTAFWNWLTEGWNSLVATLKEINDGFWGGLSELWNSTIASLKEANDNFWGSIASFISEQLTAIETYFTETLPIILETWVTVFADMLSEATTKH
jgi:phage-related protein